MTTNSKAASQSVSVDKSQLDRFKQTARELGSDETGESFEKAFAKAVLAKAHQKRRSD